MGHGGELDGGVLPAGALLAHSARWPTTRSSLWTSRAIPPQVPVRIKVSAPAAWSSSMAITAEGPPMPVEQTVTFSPSRVPV